jgi:nicotinamide riboside kinase
MMNQQRRLRIAVSGTYSTGKTTTTEALTRWLGIPRTHARTMREILPEAIPGKALEDCGPADLFQLGLMRFTERAVRESAMQGSFISDGSSLHEWVYGAARMRVGINPNDSQLTRYVKAFIRLPYRPLLTKLNDAFGAVVKRHAKRSYDEFIHLPVEFPLVKDGHRPVSEEFRSLSDRLLKETLEELGIKYHVVSGSLEQRLRTIADIYGLTPVMSVDRAIAEAAHHVRNQHIEIESDAQAAALRRQTAPWYRRIRERLAA